VKFAFTQKKIFRQNEKSDVLSANKVAV